MTWSRRMMQARPWPQQRLPEGAAGIARFHEMVASCWREDAEPDPARVIVVIELTAARGLGRWPRPGTGSTRPTRGRRPGTRRRSRTRGRRTTSSTPAAWRTWAGPACTRCARLAADSDVAEAVKIAARAHQKLVWERTRHLLRTRLALREYFPAALEAYACLTLAGKDALELLAKAPTRNQPQG